MFRLAKTDTGIAAKPKPTSSKQKHSHIVIGELYRAMVSPKKFHALWVMCASRGHFFGECRPGSTENDLNDPILSTGCCLYRFIPVSVLEDLGFLLSLKAISPEPRA